MSQFLHNDDAEAKATPRVFAEKSHAKYDDLSQKLFGLQHEKKGLSDFCVKCRLGSACAIRAG